MNSGEPMYSHKECSIKSINDKIPQGIIHWQSDYSVVSKKSRNGDGEKGIAVVRGSARDTSARLRTGVQMRTKLASLTLRARENPKYKFMTLAYLLTEDFLKSCFGELKRDKAAGIDGVRVSEYEVRLEENLKELVGRLKAKEYKPQPVRRVYKTKSNGGKRGLGIPTVEDKIVQMGIKKILEAIFEVDFLDVSFGFRPNRSCHQALEVLDKTIMTRPVNRVVDMDIKEFFDTIEHNWLMKCLEQRIKDTSLLRLIVRFLKAGIMEEGKFYRTDRTGSSFYCRQLRYPQTSASEVLAQTASTVPSTLYTNFQFLVKSDRTLVSRDHRKTDTTRFFSKRLSLDQSLSKTTWKITTKIQRFSSGALRWSVFWRRSPNVKKCWTHYTRFSCDCYGIFPMQLYSKSGFIFYRNFNPGISY